MVFNLKPIQLTEDQMQKVRVSLDKQESSRPRFSRSNDEVNFPVYRHPNHGKVIVYIPNLRMTDADGNITLRQDIANMFHVADGSQYGMMIRSVRGINLPEVGLDGIDPLDEAASAASTWFFKAAEDKGIDFKDSSEQAKTARRLLSNMKPISEAGQKHTFPVAIIETEAGKPVKGDDGNYTTKLMWMSISTNIFNKFVSAVESTQGFVDDESSQVDTPAGKIFVINYGNDENMSPGLAVRNLQISYISDDSAIRKHLNIEAIDEQAKEWTPNKAIEMVKELAIYPKAALEQIRDDILGKINTLTTGYVVPSIEGTVPDTTDADIVEGDVVNESDIDDIIGSL